MTRSVGPPATVLAMTDEASPAATPTAPSSSAPLTPDPLAPWPTLAERDSGLLPPPEYYEGVPPHMVAPLNDWVGQALHQQEKLARRVTSRLRVSTEDPFDELLAIAAGEWMDYSDGREIDPLTAVDAIISLHPHWGPVDGVVSADQEHALQRWGTQLESLDELLADAGSVWQVDFDIRGLRRRVDAPVLEGWQRARAGAEQAGRQGAARHLTEAWKQVYGMHPQYSVGYSAAVKAVEAVALPIVLPDKPRATVHQVRTELQKNGARWRFVLAEADGVAEGHGSIEVVAVMLDRLLRGETDRHAHEEVNRPSTQAEAEAAVHLAAVLVGWFVNGAIQRRESAGTNAEGGSQ